MQSRNTRAKGKNKSRESRNHQNQSKIVKAPPKQTSPQRLRSTALQVVYDAGGQLSNKEIYLAVGKILRKHFTKHDLEIVDSRPRWKKRLSRELRLLTKKGLLEKIEKGVFRLSKIGCALTAAVVLWCCGLPQTNGSIHQSTSNHSMNSAVVCRKRTDRYTSPPQTIR